MSSIIKAMREESEVIKFDNLFTNDLEQEQEFDLIFTAEQDDEDLKTIAGNAILKENGEEIETNLPDCVTVNEDGEVVDKDDEESDDSEPVEDLSNDKDENGVDDTIDKAVEAQPAQAPSVVVNVDADDVNINAADPGVDATGVAESEGESEAENNNVGMTINADTVNMTVGANAPAPAPTADITPAPSVEPAAVDVPSEDEEEDKNGDLVPDKDDVDSNGIPDEVDVAVAVAPEEPADAQEDNAEATPNTDADGAPVATDEAGMEDIYTASQLEDILNTGLEPAPAPEVTAPENEPVDPSTEVVFSDTGDQEVQEAAEPTKDDVFAPISEAEIEAIKNDENLEDSKKIEGEFEDDLAPVADGDVEKIMNDAPEDEVKEEEKIEPVKPVDVPMNDGSAHEAAEPTKDDVFAPIKEEDMSEILDDPTEGAADGNGITVPMSDDPKHRDTSALSAIDGKNTDEVEDAATTVEDLDIAQLGEASEDMDPAESHVNQDAEDSLLGIEPSLTAGDLPQIFANKADDPDKVNDGKLAEAAEPTKDDVFTPISETEIEAVKNDENLEDAKDIESENEDDLAPITDEDVEKILNDAPEDEVKKEEGIEPVKPEDVPMNDGSAHEAAEPTKDDVFTPIKEEDICIDDADPIDDKDIEKDTELSPIGPDKVIPDEVNVPEEDMNYDKSAQEKREVTAEAEIEAVKNDENLEDAKDIESEYEDDLTPISDDDIEKIMNDAPEDEVKEEEGIEPVKPEDVPMNDGSAHEAAEPTKDDVFTPIKEDFMDQINAEDNGDAFADVENTGLNISPEDVEPGSDDELIDDEIIEMVESED